MGPSIDREKVIERLEHCAETRDGYVRDCINDALELLKEQEQTINELEEKLRLLEYGDRDILQSGMMPAT